MEYWPTPEEQRKYMLNLPKSKRMLTQNTFSTVQTPEFYEKM
jgi:hypothetical protein